MSCARERERKRSAHLVLDIFETDGKVNGKHDEDDVAFRIAQWPQSVILLLPRRVPECNLNDLAIKLSVCYVVLKDGGYVRLGRCVSRCLPRGSRHTIETYFWKPIVRIDDQQARLSTAALRKTRNGKSIRSKLKRYAGLTIPDNDYLPLHIWLLVWLEFKVAAHVVLSRYRILVRVTQSVRGASRIERKIEHSRRRRTD